MFFAKKGQLGSKKWVTETLLQSYGNDIPKWMRRSLRKVTFSPTFGIFRLYHENKLHHQNPKGYNCGGSRKNPKVGEKMTLQSDRRIHPEIHFLIDYDKVSVTHFSTKTRQIENIYFHFVWIFHRFSKGIRTESGEF